MKDKALQKGLLSEIETDNPKYKNYQSIRKLFWEYLNKLNVPFSDECCTTATSLPSPAGFDIVDEQLQYYDPETKTWIPVPISGGTQDLQSVTDVDNVTTNSISVSTDFGGFTVYSSGQPFIAMELDSTTEPRIAVKNGIMPGDNAFIRFDNVTDDRIWQLPDASGTIALLSDIPSIPSITASNGLTKTLDDIRLGGTLDQNTNIAMAGFRIVNTGAYGVVDGSGMFELNNTTGNGGGAGSYALRATTVNGGAISANATSGIGIRTNGNTFGLHATAATNGHPIFGDNSGGASASGVYGASGNGSAPAIFGEAVSVGAGGEVPARFRNSSNGDLDVISVGTIIDRNTPNAVVLAGYGIALDFALSTASTTNIPNSNRIVSRWTNPANGVATSELVFFGLDSTVMSELLTLSGDGEARLHNYGINTFAGTPAYMLGVDASGNVVEVSGSDTFEEEPASYPLIAADFTREGNITKEMNVVAANTVTIDDTALASVPVGYKVNITQYGSGQTQIVTTGAAVILSSGGADKIANQYGWATIVKRSPTEFYLVGDITT